MHSSRVGVRTSARTGWRAGLKLVFAWKRSRSKIGRTKRGGLARPGLGGGEEVAALEDERDGLGLDGRRGRVALFGDGAEEVGREAEISERQAVWLRWAVRLGRRVERRGCDEVMRSSGAARASLPERRARVAAPFVPSTLAIVTAARRTPMGSGSTTGWRSARGWGRATGTDRSTGRHWATLRHSVARSGRSTRPQPATDARRRRAPRLCCSGPPAAPRPPPPPRQAAPRLSR